MSRIIAAYILHARRVMISRRCNSSSIVRCMSELSKKQWSVETQGCHKKFYLSSKNTLPPISECDMKK